MRHRSFYFGVLSVSYECDYENIFKKYMYSQRNILKLRVQEYHIKWVCLIVRCGHSVGH